MDFHYFKAVFKEVVENEVVDSRGCLTCIIKFTKGEVEEIVKNCIQLHSEVIFKTAKRLLDKGFRELHIITASYCLEIKQGPQIKTGDADAF